MEFKVITTKRKKKREYDLQVTEGKKITFSQEGFDKMNLSENALTFGQTGENTYAFKAHKEGSLFKGRTGFEKGLSFSNEKVAAALGNNSYRLVNVVDTDVYNLVIIVPEVTVDNVIETENIVEETVEATTETQEAPVTEGVGNSEFPF